MALSGSTVFEVRFTGSDTNGGGWVTGSAGTDYSQQNAAQYALTNGVATTGNATVNTVSASADMVGNIAYVAGGTGAIVAGWYQIISQVTGTSITLDRSTGLVTGTGVTINIGGALASPGVAVPIMTTHGIKAWVKYSATPFPLTTATAGAAGPASFPNFGVVLEGYDQARGDRTGNRPTLQWQVAPGANTYAIIFNSATFRQHVANMRVDGNSQANASGINAAFLRATASDCVVANCNQAGTIGILGLLNGTFNYRCQAVSCLTGYSAGSYLECDAVSCTTGYSQYQTVMGCLARSCTNGFSTTLSGAVHDHCTADGNTTAGFVTTGSASYSSCLSTNQSGAGGVGYSCYNGGPFTSLINCAAYNNLTNVTGIMIFNEGPFASGQTLTSLGADPYVNRAGNDFRPNNNTPGGAQIRGAGLSPPSQVNNQDIGAVQHTDPVTGVAAPIVAGVSSLIVDGMLQR